MVDNGVPNPNFKDSWLITLKPIRMQLEFFMVMEIQCCSFQIIDMLYFHFKQGGWPSQGLDKNELLVHKATQYGDPNQLVNTILKYSPRLACIVKITHMEGEEIFSS
jgi:hypothetical protein